MESLMPVAANSACRDHQSFLAASFQSRNIHRFRLALLLSDVSPDLPDVDADGQLSIFEQCCRTPGYHEFVRECIRWGCDINKKNPLTERTAINFAVDSGDVDNIRAVLENPVPTLADREQRDRDRSTMGAKTTTANADVETTSQPADSRRSSNSTQSSSSSSSSSSETLSASADAAKTDKPSALVAVSPLAQLARNMNADNFEDIFQCIKELISRRAANVNAGDRASPTSTPLLLIANSERIGSEQKERVVQYFLDNTRVDLDGFAGGNGAGETRFILNAQFPHMRLPEPRQPRDRRVWDFGQLMDVLAAGREADFLRGLQSLLKQRSSTAAAAARKLSGGAAAAVEANAEGEVTRLFRDRFFNETLLMVAARKGMRQAAEKLLEYGADVNNYYFEQHPGASMLMMNAQQPKHANDDDDAEAAARRLPVELACLYGNWEVLELFLRRPNLQLGDAPLLVNVVRQIGDEPPAASKTCDYRRCFYLLLNSGRVDVNQTDAAGCTALHAAVRYNNQPEILALLERGAYIGSPNKYNDLPITDIDARVLETHFNRCISTNGRRPGDDNYEIRFDYTNLVPLIVRKQATGVAGVVSTTVASSKHTSSAAETSGASLSSSAVYGDADPYATRTAALPQCTDEMAPIEYMSRSAELKHLVKHPLIASFLFLKWHQLALVFYANFICYTIYCLAMIMYVLFCYGRSGPELPNAGLAALLYVISLFGTLYVLAREIAQLVMSPKVYVRNKENYLELVLITTTVIVLMNLEFAESTRKTVASFTILLAVSEFFLLTGSLPVLSFSTHLVMLKTVAKSFMKGLLLYSIILIAFALCFYTLLGDVQRDVGAVADDIADFNNFVHPGVAIVKAVVMLTGEFDASNVHFKQNYVSYVLFVVFVLLISTVLSNLLNGLAVNDTAVIKSEAELMNFIYRAKLMARYEKILLGKGENVCCNFLLRKWSSSMMNVFPEFLPLNMLTVLPNANNQVVIPLTPADHHRRSPGGAHKQHTHQYRLAQQHAAAAHYLEEGGIGNYRQLEGTVRALNCCFGIRCSSMEVKIVKYAKHVLETKDRDLREQKEREQTQQRIVNIEQRMAEVLAEVKRQGESTDAEAADETDGEEADEGAAADAASRRAAA